MASIADELAKLNVSYASLFKDIKFCLIECTHPDQHDVKTLLQNGGAKQISYMSDMVTHVISDTDENSDVSEAREIFEKPVVTCSWVIMSIKCNVLLPVDGFAPESNQLFSSIVACPSKIPKKDCHTLWALISYHGGKFQLKQDKSCTHVICTLPEGKKFDKALHKDTCVVTPDWVIDSVKAKEKCDESLYHPRLLILPKTPTPSPPPAPTPPPMPVEQPPPPVSSIPSLPVKPPEAPHPMIVSNQPVPSSGINMPISSAVSPIRVMAPNSSVVSSASPIIGQHRVLWQQQQMQRPQISTAQRMQHVLTVSSAATTQQSSLQTANVAWQQRPQQAVLTASTASTASPRAAIWQEQLAAQGRLTPQQQMILQQKALHQQQQQNAQRLALSQRLPNATQQIPISHQQRLQLQNQHPMMSRPAISQQLMMSQMQQNASQPQQRLTAPQQQQPQQVPQANIQQRPLVMGGQLQQRLQIVQQMRPVVQGELQKVVQVPRHPRQALTAQQQQQLLWQQQQQQQQQQPRGARMQVGQRQQVQYDPQSQAQLVRLQQQQQAMWQQRRQLLLANQQQQQQQQQRPVGGAAVAAPAGQTRMQLAVGPQRIVQQNIPSHPPPPYPGKNTAPQVDELAAQGPREPTPQPAQPQQPQQPQNVVPQVGISQPIINSAGQIVTPKTKTALANLLNTRLQTSPNQKDAPESPQIQQARQRKDSVSGPDAVSAVVMKPTIQFYGLDPEVRVPPSSCLIGCTFYIADYESPVNKVEMWKKVIKYHGGEVESKYSNVCTHVVCESTKNPVLQQALRESKRCVTAFWLNDVIIQKNMMPPWKALHIPSPCIHDKPCRQHMITVSGFEGPERKCLQEMIVIAGAKYTGHMSRLNTLLICKKNEGSKFEKAIEWKIPAVNGQWINDILFGHYEAMKCPNSSKYQNFNLENSLRLDFTNIHHLMFAWRSPIRVSDQLLAKCVERPPLRTLNTLNEPKSTEPPSKRIKLSSDDNEGLKAKPRVMFSGLGDTTTFAKIVEKLGGTVVSSVKECSHLIVKNAVRTMKVLCCISYCDFIVTFNWLVESEQQNKFIDEEKFIPEDPDMETHIGCNLKRTLLRKERSLIFQGLTFYVTPTVPPSFKLLCSLIECGGGKTIKKPPKVNEIQAMNKEGAKFIVVTSDADMHLCRKYFTNDIGVYNPEIVLTSLMNQYLDLEIFKYKSEVGSGSATIPRVS